MNHLAHAFLSPAESAWLVGNVVADSVRGRPSGPFAEGIRMHRRIDAFVDEHPAFVRAIRELPSEFRRYGGIALDVLFDYLLANRWEALSSVPLDAFSARVYAALRSHEAELPEAFRPKLGPMIARDWLGGARRVESLERTLAYLGTRLRRENPLDRIAPVLFERRSVLDDAFGEVWSDAVSAAREVHPAAAPFAIVWE